MLIKNGLIFGADNRFAPGSLRIENGRIAAISTDEQRTPAEQQTADRLQTTDQLPTSEPVARTPVAQPDDFDAAGCYVIPGLVDIHIHGCAGRDSCDGQPGALEAMGRFLASQGVTTFLPATLSLPEDRLLLAIREFRAYQDLSEADNRSTAADNPSTAADGFSTAAGLYMEGPFFAREKRGAHAEAYLTDVNPDLFTRLDAASRQQIRVACVAPEKPGALEFIARAKMQLKDRLAVSVAHTMADYDTAIAAFDAGATLVTHLFNAMRPFGHREPAVPGAAFDRQAFVELIADGIHIHPAMLRAAFRLYGADRVVLVSDAMAACGMPDGEYKLGNLEVVVANGAAHLHDGTIAGSAVHLAEALRRVVRFGIPPADAVAAATINPARAINLQDRIGMLAVGRQADLLVCNQQLEVVRVMLRGKWLGD